MASVFPLGRIKHAIRIIISLPPTSSPLNPPPMVETKFNGAVQLVAVCLKDLATSADGVCVVPQA